MTKFKLRFSEKKIAPLAKQYAIGYDETMREMQSVIHKRGWLTLAEFKAVSKWLKVPFAGATRNKGTLQEIVTATSIALANCEESEKWEALVSVRGVQKALASSILHWFAEDDYPIASNPALWSCSVTGKNDVSFWLDYTKFCREIAESNGVSMRVLDRALSQHHDNERKKAGR